MQNIIFDTNAIISILAHRIDMENELNRICDFNYKICILSGTIAELEKLINEGSLQQKKAARLALKFIKSTNIEIINAEGNVDDALVSSSKEAVIVTQDKELKKRLNTRFITIRQKSHLIWS